MHSTALKVGELARRTGLTVRTLHHYDELGLVCPSQRTEGGHRLYTAADMARLQQVVSLRGLGLSLDAIRDTLDGEGSTLLGVIESHLARLDEQIAEQQRLFRQLTSVAAALRARQDVTVDTLIETIEATNMLNKYYSEEQLDQLRQRREAIGEDGMRCAEQEWASLIEDIRAARADGEDPASERVQTLARRWWDLIQQFTGGDPGIAQSLNRMYQDEGPEAASHGAVDAELFEYMGQALAAMNGKDK
ncbi:MAG: MerR family transcriptional regulator [Candidatus Hydrogenedentes bacterium]|nr:MerR family transcriptional regulator [Candidatus Hydrogenedentota bacterium]